MSSGAVRFVVVFYFLFGLLGLGMIGWRVDDGAAFDPLAAGDARWPLHLAASVCLLAGVHGLSWIAVRRWRAVANGVREMVVWLGCLNRREALTVALASGLAEEIVFRGWLLNEVGLFWSSLLFGIVHVPPSRNWLYWPVFAFLMGVLLGALCLWTGTLLYAILVHAGINFINILRLPRAVSGARASDG